MYLWFGLVYNKELEPCIAVSIGLFSVMVKLKEN